MAGFSISNLLIFRCRRRQKPNIFTASVRGNAYLSLCYQKVELKRAPYVGLDMRGHLYSRLQERIFSGMKNILLFGQQPVQLAGRDGYLQNGAGAKGLAGFCKPGRNVCTVAIAQTMRSAYHLQAALRFRA